MKSKLFIVFLGALSAFAPFSTDVYLASMPTIEHIFQTTAANVQLTLSLFFVSFAVMQLVWGPLSDRVGRKPVIFVGVGLFALASLFCAWSQSIEMLIISRIIQAIGACAGIVVAMAIIKDTFTDTKQMAKILSAMVSIMILAPIVAPIVGSYLLVHLGWQANFYFLACYGGLLFVSSVFISESHPQPNRSPLPAKHLVRAYCQQISVLPFLLAVMAMATNFSVMFAFISSSSFIYIRIYHLPEELFGYYFAFNAVTLILGSITFNRLKGVLSDQVITYMALCVALLGALSMVIALLLFSSSMWSVVVPSFITTYGVGILFPHFTSLALSHVLQYNGLASSLLGTCRFILAAITGFLMGLLVHHSALPLAEVMLAYTLLTLVSMWLYFRVTQKSRAPLKS